MAGFAFNDYTPSYAYSDDKFTTSATSVYYGAPYDTPVVVSAPPPETKAKSWLDQELDVVMSVGRAEAVLA